MKLHLSIFILVLVFNIKGNAQSSASITSNAETLFASYNFEGAANEYLKLFSENVDDTYLQIKLAEIYYLLYNDQEAIRWFEKAIVSNKNPEFVYMYAQTLMRLGNLKEYNNQMNVFVGLKPNDSRSITYLNSLKQKSKILTNDFAPTLTSISINSEADDYGAFMSNDKLYFTSNRKIKRNRRANKNSGKFYTKLFQAEFSGGNFSNTKELEGLNSRANDGTVTFSSDQSIAYFSSSVENINPLVKRKNRYKGNDVDKKQLFTAKKDKYGYWYDFEVLSFCNKDFTYLNPTISPDGKTLYFVSNLEGGFGGLDIWKVNINENNSFVNLQNMGSIVNTEFDENFPFINDDNKTLNFASKGHDGFGGYDVFKIDLQDVNDKPKNIGIPYNSDKDDFAYSFSSKNQMEFISSDREGNVNIYALRVPEQEELIATFIDAKTGDLLINESILVMNEQNNVVETLTTNEAGQVSYVVEAKSKYKLKFENSAYETFESELFKAEKGTKLKSFNITKLEVKTPEPITYKPSNIFFEFDKYELSDESIDELDKIAILLNTNNNLKLDIIAHTDSRGSADYNIKLSNKRAKSAFDYLVSKGVDESKLTMTGMGENELLINCGDNCTEEDHAKNRRSEFKFINDVIF